MDDNQQRRRTRQYQQHEQQRQQRRKLQTLTIIWLILIGITAALAIIPLHTTTWANTISGNDCRATLTWPVISPHVTSAFDGPEQPWLPGHRGVDLQATTNDTILAPDDGIISFAGTVAGKSVVSINHGNITSTFEPATTHLKAGAPVTRGQHIAQINGGSDHCGNTCLHWGIKQGTDTYLDPETLTTPQRIALKPIHNSS